MKEEIKFRLGDSAYFPYHGYGTIVEIVDTDASYPITVRWDESRYKLGVDLSTFTEDGYLFFGNKTENTKITKVEGEKMGQLSGVVAQNIERKMKEDNEKMSPDAEMFHVGDHVWSPHFGAGVVTGTTTTDENNLYPIKVDIGYFPHRLVKFLFCIVTVAFCFGFFYLIVALIWTKGEILPNPYPSFYLPDPYFEKKEKRDVH